MSKGKPTYHFKSLKQKYQSLAGIEVLLWTISVGLLAFFGANIFATVFFISLGIALFSAAITFLVGSRRLKLFTIQEHDLAAYLNRHYPALQESTDLLLKNDEELTPLQRVQKARTVQRLDEIYPIVKLPHHIGRAASVLVMSIAASIVLTSFSLQADTIELSETVDASEEVMDERLPASVKIAKIMVIPPAYTGIKKSASQDFNLKIPEGSIVQWSLTFEGATSNQKIIFSAKDSISLSNHNSVEKNFTTPGFYQLQWTNPNGQTQTSDYYKIDVIKDHAPTITVETPDQFLELDAHDNLKVGVKANLTDDYELSQATIIATVSKGSGEAIKFREEKLSFDTPQKISGKSISAFKTLDLGKLGLEPGDELYFYIEGSDNKTPAPNRSRTETFFITLQDTSSMTTSIDAGLGVDLMPEYFRSQRQIIIDTEKLLKEKKRIPKQTFNNRNNELAHDQKVLRLRYGEFLGEEFETSIGPHSAIEDDENEDIQKRFGHAHDTDNEHNLVDEKDHKHDDHKETSGQKQDPLSDFVHAHDGEEEATFFVQSIRAKLKAAVTIMWDAELHLRLYTPDKSLPYQYKALKLLKDISQESRIYVHRTGFDPPPLKEEKRLTADLSDIRNSTSNTQSAMTEQYPHIRAALPVVEKLFLEDSPLITGDIKKMLTNAGHEVAQTVLQNPGQYLKTLSALKMIMQEDVSKEVLKNTISHIRNSFWKILPEKTMSPQSPSGVTHDLDLEFLKSLEAPSEKNN